MTTGAGAALRLGTQVRERYQVIGVVGQGGLGTVYKVTDTAADGEPVFALKELADQAPGARKQFTLEAEWLKSLHHPTIPRYRESFAWGDRLYLLMDFVEGENLEEKFARRGRRPLAEHDVVAWILPICDALTYLHSRVPPILHRDVKPANIIVTPTGHPVLVDLGIAKEHLPGANNTNTFVRKAGTEGYAPPEQYTANGQSGPWSDVYGVGATLYYLLSGRLPPTAVERVALDMPLLHVRQLNPLVSGSADAAIVRSLAIRPTDRFHTVPEFVAALTAEIASIRNDTSASGAGFGASGAGPLTSPHVEQRTSVPYSGAHSGGFDQSGQLAGLSGSLPAIRPATPPPASFPRSRSESAAQGLPPLRFGRAEGQTGADRSVSHAGLAFRGGLSTPYRALDSAPSVPSGTAREASFSQASLPPPITPPAFTSQTVASVATDTRVRPHRRRVLMWGVVILAMFILGAGVAFVFSTASGAFAPPDQSSPAASVSGYFAALRAGDDNRAWQYVSATRNDPSSRSAFIAGLQGDDAQNGRVQSVSIGAVTTDNAGHASVTVTVVRGASASSMRYAVQLSQFDGNTWLIDSISST